MKIFARMLSLKASNGNASLITDGCGFLGRNLVNELVNKDSILSMLWVIKNRFQKKFIQKRFIHGM